MIKIFPIILFGIITISCIKPDIPHNPSIQVGDLILLDHFVLNIEDPSGLSRSPLPDHFLTISDKSGMVYLINNIGTVIMTINLQGHDLEGIEYIHNESMIYVLEEQLKWVLRLTTNGTVVDTFQLSIPNQNPNDGPEGLAYNPQNQRFYVVNERNPAMLYVYDKQFTLISEHPLNFAIDYSSVDYNNGYLWILSDESKLLARCDLTGVPEKLFNTSVPKGEGVIVDGNRVYIVCDQTSGFYIFRFPEEE
jgi:uncharacterized protein YjiK